MNSAPDGDIDADSDGEDWRGEIEHAAREPEIIDITAPLLLLEHGAPQDEVLRVLRDVATRLGDGPGSLRSAVRGQCIDYMKAVLKVHAPARLVDDVFREGLPSLEKDRSTTDALVDLVRTHCELFHDGEGSAYAYVTVGEHQETHPVRGITFRRWLVAAYFATTESAATGQAVADALSVAEGFAFRDGAARKVFVRFARDEGGCAYLDLGDECWSAVKIETGAWSVVTDPPVRFRRPRGMRSLPIPERGAGVELLFDPVHVPSDEETTVRLLHLAEMDQSLILSALVSIVLVRSPYVVLALVGEQGSGKSTAARVLRALVDPVKAPLRSPPRDERDLVIAANASGIVAFDNVSTLSERLSDALCRLSTGAGFSTRELYADAEEFLFEGTRPILMTGITKFVQRPDLLDRSVVIEVPRLQSGRVAEEDFYKVLALMHPRLLGAILDLAASALTHLDAAKHLIGLGAPRMGDFARIGVAVDLARGGDGRQFLKRYGMAVASAAEQSLASDSTAIGLIDLMASRSHWEGTAAKLLAELAPGGERHTAGLPRTPRGLRSALDRLAPHLRTVGIAVEYAPRSDHRIVRITRTMAANSVDNDAQATSGSPNADRSEGPEPGLPAVDRRGKPAQTVANAEASSARTRARQGSGGERAPCAECGSENPFEGARSGCNHCQRAAPDDEWGSM